MSEPRQFAYIGDHNETNVLGMHFVQGEPTPVTDEKVAAKLSTNCDFSEVVEGVEVMAAKKKPGRPRKTEA